ncbi:efflux RND transporter periplasmic adaptor subunit [Pectobacterium punjabense]|uniref:efflux RND transporter periplasmic adaptor subunit n=1 Tax=Pectobacterium punjabense TaxID=2108399 RepID=UPI001BFFC4B5|nr:efflux RND transporter periplasmic adaptor subunit [Pectobacterium punjabense]MBT9183793.1 efflux RND transporter periplasmic adaptor subunit [Pectobacterium punjabense]
MLRLKSATIAVCLLPLALVACGDASDVDDPRNQPPLVRSATVVSAVDASRAFTGIVIARVQSDLGFRVQGKILERLVNTGESVKRGQPLMRLDPIDLNLQAQAQQQAVIAARARARQATDDEARYRGLVAAGAISASTYDQIKAAAETAKADLNATQAQADVARNATGYAVLMADADGVVVDTLAEPGQVVSAGQPVVRLARAGQREAVVHLPETLRPVVGSEAMARLYGAAKPSIPAKLRLLSDAADPQTRTFEARYVLEGALASAPLGSTVTLNIAEDQLPEQVLQVPIAAIYDAGKGPGVWGISGEPLNVSWKPVEVIALGDDTARVTSGLQPGEQIVALGAHLLHDGEVIRVIEQRDASVAGSQP